GIQLGKAFGCRIKVLSIVDIRIFEWAVVMGTEGFVPMIPSNAYRDESKKILESKADAVLEKCSSMLSKENLDFETEKIQGPPADIILEKSPLVDLLVMGARGEFAKWKSNTLGATVDVIARQWNKPIFITPKKFREMSKILFAYDGSERSNKGLQLAGLLATELGIPIVILTVHDREVIRKKLLKEASIYLEPYEVPTELVGVSGNPEREICTIAEEKHCNLIIMGAFGHSRIRERILGSTTEQIIRNTNMPILLSK
ncbi:MAG: universal stress protein, partial [bacterium]